MSKRSFGEWDIWVGIHTTAWLSLIADSTSSFALDIIVVVEDEPEK